MNRWGSFCGPASRFCGPPRSGPTAGSSMKARMATIPIAICQSIRKSEEIGYKRERGRREAGPGLSSRLVRFYGSLVVPSNDIEQSIQNAGRRSVPRGRHIAFLDPGVVSWVIRIHRLLVETVDVSSSHDVQDAIHVLSNWGRTSLRKRTFRRPGIGGRIVSFYNRQRAGRRTFATDDVQDPVEIGDRDILSRRRHGRLSRPRRRRRIVRLEHRGLGPGRILAANEIENAVDRSGPEILPYGGEMTYGGPVPRRRIKGIECGVRRELPAREVEQSVQGRVSHAKPTTWHRVTNSRPAIAGRVVFLD